MPKTRNKMLKKKDIFMSYHSHYVSSTEYYCSKNGLPKSDKICGVKCNASQFKHLSCVLSACLEDTPSLAITRLVLHKFPNLKYLK